MSLPRAADRRFTGVLEAAVLAGAEAVARLRTSFAGSNPGDYHKRMILEALDPELLRVVVGPELAPCWVAPLLAHYRRCQEQSWGTWLRVEAVWRTKRASWWPAALRLAASSSDDDGGVSSGPDRPVSAGGTAGAGRAAGSRAPSSPVSAPPAPASPQPTVARPVPQGQAPAVVDGEVPVAAPPVSAAARSPAAADPDETGAAGAGAGAAPPRAAPPRPRRSSAPSPASAAPQPQRAPARLSAAGGLPRLSPEDGAAARAAAVPDAPLRPVAAGGRAAVGAPPYAIVLPEPSDTRTAFPHFLDNCQDSAAAVSFNHEQFYRARAQLPWFCLPADHCELSQAGRVRGEERGAPLDRSLAR